MIEAEHAPVDWHDIRVPLAVYLTSMGGMAVFVWWLAKLDNRRQREVNALAEKVERLTEEVSRGRD